MVEAERKRFDDLWGDDLTAEEEAKIAADKRDPVVRAEIVASTGRFMASIKIGELRERARIVALLRERATACADHCARVPSGDREADELRGAHRVLGLVADELERGE